MGSEADTFVADFCLPFLGEQFGDRDANGDFSKIRYKPPQGDAFDLVGWIVSSINGQEEMNLVRGGTNTVETMKITGPASDMDAKGIKGYQRQAKVDVAGLEYNTDALTTVFGGPMVTLGLKRQPLTAQNEGRHAGL